jgi:shikimate dehydrogenase
LNSRSPSPHDKVEHLIEGYSHFAGIIGEKPSEYSKSPSLWKAAFKEMGLKTATYVCFDVRWDELKDLFDDLRQRSNLLGLNVTVPHKTKVIELELLDGLDSEAQTIGAVNTIVHDKKGRLTGYNTDGAGAVNSLTQALPGEKQPFMKSLSGLKILLLGAGGSARAVAFSITKTLGRKGKLLICNRNLQKAQNLSQEVNKLYDNSEVLNQVRLMNFENEGELREVDLIINATTVGQSGIHVLIPPSGQRACLEKYSPLVPTHGSMGNDELNWNLKHSEELLRNVFRNAKLFDLIYSPKETVFLKQGRLAGHPTLNGRGMMIWQAVEAFCKVTKDILSDEPESIKEKILRSMTAVW